MYAAHAINGQSSINYPPNDEVDVHDSRTGLHLQATGQQVVSVANVASSSAGLIASSAPEIPSSAFRSMFGPVSSQVPRQASGNTADGSHVGLRFNLSASALQLANSLLHACSATVQWARESFSGSQTWRPISDLEANTNVSYEVEMRPGAEPILRSLPRSIDEHASTDASDGSDIACDAVSVGGLSDATAVEGPDTKSDLGGRIDHLLTAIRRLPENAEGSWDRLCVRLEDTAKRLAVPTPSAADVEAFNELLGDIWAETDDLLRAKTPPNYTKWLHMGSLFGVCLTTVAAANAACARSESASEAEIRISEIAYCVPAALMILLKALGSYIDQRHIEHPHDTVKHLRQAFHLVNSAFVVSTSAPVDGGSEATPDAQPGCASGSELAWERVPYPSEWALSQQRVQLNGEHALPQLSIELMDRVTAAWQLIIPKTLAGDEIEAQAQRVLMSDLLIALSVFSMRANDGADKPSDARQSAFDLVAQAISDIQRHSKGFASWEQKTFRISRLVKLLDVIRLSSVPVLLLARTYFRSPNPQPTETPSDELKGFYYFFRDIGIPIIAAVTAANFLLTTKHGNRTAELLRKMDVVSKRWLKQYRPTSTDHPGFRVAETPVNNLRRRSLP